MNVVVTGAMGVLGGGIVKLLKTESDYNVIATDIINANGIIVADLCT